MPTIVQKAETSSEDFGDVSAELAASVDEDETY
jgi:hypothetical protein